RAGRPPRHGRGSTRGPCRSAEPWLFLSLSGRGWVVGATSPHTTTHPPVGCGGVWCAKNYFAPQGVTTSFRAIAPRIWSTLGPLRPETGPHSPHDDPKLVHTLYHWPGSRGWL